MAGVLNQRKVVARRADLERLAHAQFVVHVTRADPASRSALDANGIASWIGLGLDQRILPHDPIRQMHVDVGAGLVSGERLAIETCELIEVGIARRKPDRSQTHVDQALRRWRLCRGCHGWIGRKRVHKLVSFARHKRPSGNEVGLSNLAPQISGSHAQSNRAGDVRRGAM